jgi:subtilisin family serine protease
MTYPASSCLELVMLLPLMERISGNPELMIGLIDGPVAIGHPDLAGEHIHELAGELDGTCTRPDSIACLHGTFVAGMLCAKRDSAALAICPDCTLLIRPVFTETTSKTGQIPRATTQQLATAIIDCIQAGVNIINLSVGLAQPSIREERELKEALDHAAKRGVIVAAAAGNQGTLGSSTITRHPWVIPVVGCDASGSPMKDSNLSSSISRRGLSAPGDNITSLGAEGKSLTLSGTSVAVPFVTGAIALLWSEFPAATGTQLKLAVTGTSRGRRNSIVPPLLDAWAAYQAMAA